MSKAFLPHPEKDPLSGLEQAIQQHDAKAVAQWFMDQKEIPTLLQISAGKETPESKYKDWEPLAATFSRLVQHQDTQPPKLSFPSLQAYLEGILLALQEILNHSDDLIPENQQKLFDLTQAYGHALFFCSGHEVIIDCRPGMVYIDAVHQNARAARQQAVKLVLKNEKDFKTFLQHGSPIFFSPLLKYLIRENPPALSKLLQHGLPVNYRLRTRPIHHNHPQDSLLEYAITNHPQDSLLEYVITTPCLPIALELLKKGALFDLPDPSDHDSGRLLVCINLLKLEAKDTKATETDLPLKTEEVPSETELVSNPAKQKICNHATILLSRCLQNSTPAPNKRLITECLELGIRPTSKQKETLIQNGIKNSADATYFFNIFIFESPKEWKKRAKILTEQNNPEVRQKIFLGLLMAYESAISQSVTPSMAKDLKNCRQALIDYAKSDKVCSKRLIPIFFESSSSPIFDLLLEGCGRLSTPEDFKRLFSVQSKPIFNFRPLSSFILLAVSLDENNYQSFVEAAVKYDIEIFFKALKLLQQPSNISESQPPLEPGLIEKMFKAISLHKMECSYFLMKLISKENPQKDIFYFVDQTGYQPVLNPALISTLFVVYQLLPLFPEIFPETPDTFAPLVEAASNPSDNEFHRAHCLQSYAELTYCLAARPGDPLAHKAVEEILINLLYLPSSLSTIITDYLPQKGDFPGSIWPQFREQLLSLPIDEKPAPALVLQHYLPNTADKLSTFQPFLKNFDCYFTRESYAVALADIWDNHNRAFKELPYALPLLYHRTVMMADVKDSKINDVTLNAIDYELPQAEEAVKFLYYSGLTGRLPRESLLWTCRRPLITLNQTRQIVLEWGFSDRDQLTQRQLSALCRHADAYPVELLYEAVQQENTALLDFLVGDPEERKGIGLDINCQRTDKGKDEMSFHPEPNVLMVAIKNGNQTAITRLLLRKAKPPRTTIEDLRELDHLLSQEDRFSVYVQAIVSARKEAATMTDPALSAHLAMISFEAVRVSTNAKETTAEIKQRFLHFNEAKKAQLIKKQRTFIKMWDLPENQSALNALMNAPGFKRELISLRCTSFSVYPYSVFETFRTHYQEHTLLATAIKAECRTFIERLRELIDQEADAIIASSALSPSSVPEFSETKEIENETKLTTIKDHPRFILFEQLIDLHYYDLMDMHSKEDLGKSSNRIRHFLKANPPELTDAFHTQIMKWRTNPRKLIAESAFVTDPIYLTSLPDTNEQIPQQPALSDEKTKLQGHSTSSTPDIPSQPPHILIGEVTQQEDNKNLPTEEHQVPAIQTENQEPLSEVKVKEHSRIITESKISNEDTEETKINPVKSTEIITLSQPWWKNRWLLPMLGLAEGVDLGERWLLPFLKTTFLEDNAISALSMQFITLVPPAVAGFLLGCAIDWVVKNHGTAIKKKLPPSLTTTPVLIGLLTAGLLGVPIAVECTLLLLSQWPIFQDYSVHTFVAFVVITGVMAGLLTQLGKSLYHSKCAGTFFHRSKGPILNPNENKPAKLPSMSQEFGSTST